MFKDPDTAWNYFSDDASLGPTTAPKLEKMASVSVGIALWNHATFAIPGIISNHNEWSTSLKKEVPKWVEALPVPKSFAASIINHFNTVKSSVDDWISYLFRRIFFDVVNISDLYQHISYIIWHPNGTVNSSETARNLLISDVLTAGEKFNLACTYCLREHIEKLWPTVECDNQVHDIRSSREPYLTYYWICYCDNQLENVERPCNVPIEEFSLMKYSVNNWPSIEYFFDRLDAERRVPLVISLIDNHGARFQKLLLLKLNESQRMQVIMNKLKDIVSNYAYWNNDEDIINTWYYVRDSITEDEFVTLFDTIFDNSTKDFVLTEIWNTARDDFKRYIINYGDDHFIMNLFKWCEYERDECIDFLSLVLLDPVSIDIRREITKKKFFTEWCKKLITLNAVQLLSHLINLCFPGVVGSTEFRSTLAKSPCFKKQCKTLIIGHQTEMLVKWLDFGYPKMDPSSEQFVRKFFSTHLNHLDQKCLSYYSTGNLKELNDLLAPLVSSYPEIMSNYKSKLLMSRPGFRACYDHFGSRYADFGSRNNVLAKIVADGLPADLATEFKRRIIFSPEGINKVQNMLLFSGGYLGDVEECVRWFLESDADRKVLKTILIDRLSEGRFYVSTKTERKFIEFLK